MTFITPKSNGFALSARLVCYMPLAHCLEWPAAVLPPPLLRPNGQPGWDATMAYEQKQHRALAAILRVASPDSTISSRPSGFLAY